MDCGDEAPSRPLSPELELAHKRIDDLRAELELERRMRCKAESTNKALAQELAEERRAREAAEGVLRRLEEELAGVRGKAQRAVREMEEERRMLQIAELWREERVQMKLVEAKLVMEEKLQEMLKLMTSAPPSRSSRTQIKEEEAEGANNREEVLIGVVSGQSEHGRHGQPRREVENPHIRRGIRGSVEFPRPKLVTKTQRSSSSSSARERRVTEPNLECQRAQLRILLRNRNPNGLMGTSELDQFRDLIH